MYVHVCLTVEAKLRRQATNKRTFFEINNLQNLQNVQKLRKIQKFNKDMTTCMSTYTFTVGYSSFTVTKILKDHISKRLQLPYVF